jgi:hypothetical protein
MPLHRAIPIIAVLVAGAPHAYPQAFARRLRPLIKPPLVSSPIGTVH